MAFEPCQILVVGKTACSKLADAFGISAAVFVPGLQLVKFDGAVTALMASFSTQVRAATES